MSADVRVIRSAACSMASYHDFFYSRLCLFDTRTFLRLSLNANIPRLILNVYFLCYVWSRDVITGQGLNEKLQASHSLLTIPTDIILK